MLNIISHQKNVNQSLHEVPFDTYDNKQQNCKCSDVEKLEQFYIAGWNVKWFSSCGKQFDNSSKS